jgi:hypothetical protein
MTIPMKSFRDETVCGGSCRSLGKANWSLLAAVCYVMMRTKNRTGEDLLR